MGTVCEIRLSIESTDVCGQPASRFFQARNRFGAILAGGVCQDHAAMVVERLNSHQDLSALEEISEDDYAAWEVHEA